MFRTSYGNRQFRETGTVLYFQECVARAMLLTAVGAWKSQLVV